MFIQYTFSHLCGHTAKGPLFQISSYQSPEYQTNTLQSTLIRIPLNCPFCYPPTDNDTPIATVGPGQGFLGTVGSSTSPDAAVSASWTFHRVSDSPVFTRQDYALAFDSRGQYRYLAWIPRPCGEVNVTTLGGTGPGRTRVATNIQSRWRLGAGQEYRSRFWGMMSQLDAAILPRTRVGRHES